MKSRITPLILMLLILLLSGCNKQNYSNNNIAAEVEDQKITVQEVSNVLKSQYYNVVLNNLIDLKLLELKANELGIEIDKDNIDSNKPKTVKELEYRVNLINEILKKTLDESTIKEFYDKNKQFLEKKVTRVRIYNIDHQLASKFMTLYQRGQSTESIEKELQISSSDIVIDDVTSEDPLYLQVMDLKKDEMTMVMNGESHQLVLVENIESTPISWPKDKDQIILEYLNKNSGIEATKLLESLRQEYKVKVFNSEDLIFSTGGVK